MIVLVDYNNLKIKNVFNTGTIILYKFDKIKHTPEGFYIDLSLTSSDDDWYNKFIKTIEYKIIMRKFKLIKFP